MQTASRSLIGRHDFAAFGANPEEGDNTVRTVDAAEWTQMRGGWLYFDIQADAFLYRMVRRLVFVQVAAAQARISHDQIKAALDNGTEVPAGLAPACGLTLVDIEYDGKDQIPLRDRLIEPSGIIATGD